MRLLIRGFPIPGLRRAGLNHWYPAVHCDLRLQVCGVNRSLTRMYAGLSKWGGGFETTQLFQIKKITKNKNLMNITEKICNTFIL